MMWPFHKRKDTEQEPKTAFIGRIYHASDITTTVRFNDGNLRMWDEFGAWLGKTGDEASPAFKFDFGGGRYITVTRFSIIAVITTKR